MNKQKILETIIINNGNCNGARACKFCSIAKICVDSNWNHSNNKETLDEAIKYYSKCYNKKSLYKLLLRCTI